MNEDRRKGIGGSDAPVVCGLSPWKTPYQLWLEKRGEGAVGDEDSEPMFWGRALEPVIRQRYADLTGRRVKVERQLLVHPKHEWMCGHPDGITEDGRVLEVKTARMPTGWGEPGTDEIPDTYAVQVQHYLALTSLKVADVVVLIAGSDFRLFEIPADAEVQGLIISREEAFWQGVVDGTPPMPRTYDDLRLHFGAVAKARRVQADATTLGAYQRLVGLREAMKEEKELKAAIMKKLGEADTLVDGDTVLATWKMSKPVTRFDQKLLKEEQPEVYDKYLTEGSPQRRLLIK